MGTKRKGRCIYTQFDKEVLCAGTMKEYVEIYSREIQGTEPGVTIQAGEDFTLIGGYAGYFEMKKGTPRWNGVSTEDQSESSFTHAIYLPYDQDIYELDKGKLFVKKPGSRDRYFKLKLIMNWDEESEWLQLQCAETGFADLQASLG